MTKQSIVVHPWQLWPLAGCASTAGGRGAGEHADQPNRIAQYWLDLARAWLRHGDRDRRVDPLARARAIPPEHVRYNPSLHETIATLAAQDSRRTDSLAALARWAGVRLTTPAGGGRARPSSRTRPIRRRGPSPR